MSCASSVITLSCRDWERTGCSPVWPNFAKFGWTGNILILWQFLEVFLIKNCWTYFDIILCFWVYLHCCMAKHWTNDITNLVPLVLAQVFLHWTAAFGKKLNDACGRENSHTDVDFNSAGTRLETSGSVTWLKHKYVLVMCHLHFCLI